MYGSKTEFSLYILFTELYMARVWRCRVTYDQHPRTSYSTEFPPGTQFPAWANHNTLVSSSSNPVYLSATVITQKVHFIGRSMQYLAE